jgi:hypothetical protein
VLNQTRARQIASVIMKRTQQKINIAILKGRTELAPETTRIPWHMLLKGAAIALERPTSDLSLAEY